MSIKLLALTDPDPYPITSTDFTKISQLDLDAGASYLIIATGTVRASSLSQNNSATIRLRVRTGILSSIESTTNFQANPELVSTWSESFALILPADSLSAPAGPGPGGRPAVTLSVKKDLSSIGGFTVGNIRIAALQVDEIDLTEVPEH